MKTCKTCKHFDTHLFSSGDKGQCTKNSLSFIGYGGYTYVTPCDLELEWYREESGDSPLRKMAQQLLVTESFGCIKHEKKES